MIKYFNDEIEYPNVCNGEILPFNVLYTDVSTKFLDAFINNCEKHLICYTLDYYRKNDSLKKKYIDDINVNGYNGLHTNLHTI